MEVNKKVPASWTQKAVDKAFFDDVCCLLYSFASEIEIPKSQEMYLQ
jgi:hypothetical protein